MRRITRTLFLFTIYLFVTISNIASVFGIFDKTVSFVLTYASFAAFIAAFFTTFSGAVDPKIKHLYRKGVKFSRFVLLFYLVGIVVSVMYMHYNSLYVVLPNMIRNTLSLLMFPYLFCFIFFNDRTNYLIKALTVILTIASLSVIVFNLMGVELSYFVYTDLTDADSDVIGRSSGVFLNANAAAQFSVYAIIFLLYFVTSQKSKNKALLFVLVLLCAFAIFMTFSTTGFLNLLVILILFAYNKYKSKVTFIVHLVLFLVLFQIPLAFLINFKNDLYRNYDLPKIQQEKIDNILNIISFNDSKDINYSKRDQLLQKGLQRVVAQPILGYGAGEFMSGIDQDMGVHNTYIQIIGEAGVFMLISYLVMCFKLLKECFSLKNRQLHFLLTGIIVSTLIYQITTHGILYNETILLIIVFINCLTVYAKYQEQKISQISRLTSTNDAFDLTSLEK